MWTFPCPSGCIPFSECSPAFAEPTDTLLAVPQTAQWQTLPQQQKGLTVLAKGETVNLTRTPLLPEQPTGEVSAGSRDSRSGASPGITELASGDILRGHPHRLLSYPRSFHTPAFIDSLFLSCGQNRLPGFKLWVLMQEPVAVRKGPCRCHQQA